MILSDRSSIKLEEWEAENNWFYVECRGSLSDTGCFSWVHVSCPFLHPHHMQTSELPAPFIAFLIHTVQYYPSWTEVLSVAWFQGGWDMHPAQDWTATRKGDQNPIYHPFLFNIDLSSPFSFSLNSSYPHHNRSQFNFPICISQIYPFSWSMLPSSTFSELLQRVCVWLPQNSFYYSTLMIFFLD